jgi:predicted transcriptional regulator
MPRPKSASLTEGELRLMQVLWEQGEATVGAIVDALDARPKPAYNSVLTLLRFMERKGYVSHRKDGRAFVFLPRVGRDEAGRNALRTLVNRFFAGSPGLLMQNLLDEKQLSPETLRELKHRIEEAE